MQQHTANLQSTRNLMARNSGHSLSAKRIRALSFDEVDELLPDPDLALAVKSNLAVMRTLQGVIASLEKRVKSQVRLRPAFKPLLTVSGIGDILGLTIMLETGEIGRFPEVGNYASRCRCVGSAHMSNGKRKGRGNTKNGNEYLAWGYVEPGNFAVRYNPQIRRYYQRTAACTHPVVAIKTVAHKLARACYYILRDQVPFGVRRAFT